MPKLRTTTWKRRNYERLERVREEAVKVGLSYPIIIDVGPGGLTRFLLDYFPSGKREYWTPMQKLRRGVLKLVDDFCRRNNFVNLESSEPQEIADLFNDLQPQKIVVVDSQPKVIEAVKRMVQRNGMSIPFDYIILDLLSERIPYKGDVVIAYNVAQIMPNPERTIETIANSVNIGGLLSLDRDVELTGFRRIDRGLYVKQY